jgi:hypothetical protein
MIGMTSGPTVALVYVRWFETQGDSPLVTLVEHLARHSRSTAAVCVVDNRPGLPPVAARIPRLSLIAGENSEREFSGYEAGVRHLRRTGTSPELWVLANDRFAAYGLDYLWHVNQASLDVAASLLCAIGHVDSWPERVRLLGFDIPSWARSNLLVIPERSLRAMGSLVSVDTRRFHCLLPDAPLSPAEMADPALTLRRSFDVSWSELTTDCLTGVGTRVPWHWHQAGPLDQSSWPAFRGKVHSIVNEQLLSARLRQSGTPVVPLPLAVTVGSLPATSVRTIASSAIRRWPATSAAIARTRGVVRAVRSCASVESSVRAGLWGVLR